MRCDWCHKIKDGTKRYMTVYGYQQFCPECLIKWNERKIRKESGKMRFVMFKNRIFALDIDLGVENVGTLEDLAYAIRSSTGQFSSITLTGVDLKDCENCEEYFDIWGKKVCDCIHDPTCECDDRFCRAFEPRDE